MNWDMVAAMGEVVAAAAVVLSLVYLSRQIAMSNRLAQAEAWRSSIGGVTTLNAAFGVDPRFDQLMTRIMQGEDVSEFEPDDAAILTSYLVSIANIYEQVFREVRDGVLDQRALDEFFVGRILFETTFFRTRWAGLRLVLGQPFVEWVERTHHMPLPGSNEEDARPLDRPPREQSRQADPDPVPAP